MQISYLYRRKLWIRTVDELSWFFQPRGSILWFSRCWDGSRGYNKSVHCHHHKPHYNLFHQIICSGITSLSRLSIFFRWFVGTRLSFCFCPILQHKKDLFRMCKCGQWDLPQQIPLFYFESEADFVSFWLTSVRERCKSLERDAGWCEEWSEDEP